VLAGNTAPDHVTVARFRVRHQQALAGVLVQSLQLCAAAPRARGQQPRSHIKPPRRRGAQPQGHRQRH
jgi:hypothetical protein